MPASIVDPRHAVVRADASAAAGIGHVTRSMALAEEMAADGWAVTLCASGVAADLTDSSPVELVTTSPGPDPAPVLALEPDLVVVDGYDFTAAFYESFERRGVPYAVIDDDGSTPAPRPVAVVNQNPHAHPGLYAHLGPAPVLLLGTEFALLRREVRAAAGAERPERAAHVLVAFGGSDPAGLTVPVARALRAAGVGVHVAVGAAHADRDAVVGELTAEGFDVVVPGEYVAELASAGVAVLAAGSSLWEAACLGTPTVAVVVASNQRDPAAAAVGRGLVHRVFEVGARLLVELPAAVCAALADPGRAAPSTRPAGTGASRVAAALGATVAGPIALRAASADDSAFLFRLRHDADVDRQSFGPAPSAAEHEDWLTGTLDDPARRLYVIEERGSPIGQLRLDADPDHRFETVSLALVDGARGRGAGVQALRAARSAAPAGLVARIRPGNGASIRAFARAGFSCVPSGEDEVVMRWP